jgi:hypothetical protein
LDKSKKWNNWESDHGTKWDKKTIFIYLHIFDDVTYIRKFRPKWFHKIDPSWWSSTSPTSWEPTACAPVAPTDPSTMSRYLGSNPMIGSHNASLLKIYNALGSLVRYDNKKYYLLWKTL